MDYLIDKEILDDIMALYLRINNNLNENSQDHVRIYIDKLLIKVVDESSDSIGKDVMTWENYKEFLMDIGESVIIQREHIMQITKIIRTNDPEGFSKWYPDFRGFLSTLNH